MKNLLTFLFAISVICCVQAAPLVSTAPNNMSDALHSKKRPEQQPIQSVTKAPGVQQHSSSRNHLVASDHIVTQGQRAVQLKNSPLQKNESLQEVINKLSDKDRKIVLEIQQEISTWPSVLISELDSYREFVLSARKEAEARYDNLSPQAKRALIIEKDLRDKLSSKAVEALNNAHIESESGFHS